MKDFIDYIEKDRVQTYNNEIYNIGRELLDLGFKMTKRIELSNFNIYVLWSKKCEGRTIEVSYISYIHWYRKPVVKVILDDNSLETIKRLCE